MITTLRITNREEAKTALLMIEAYLTAFPTEDVVVPVDVDKVEEKPTRKPRAPKKPAEKTEVKAEEEKVVEPEPTPVKEEKTVTEPSKVTLTIGDLTTLAKKAVAGSDRDTVKDLIASHGTGKLSSVEPEKFEALAEELKALV